MSLRIATLLVLVGLLSYACGIGPTSLPAHESPATPPDGLDSQSSETSPVATVSDIFDANLDPEHRLLFIQSCLADHGFRAEVDLLFGTVSGDFGDQEDAFKAAWDDCRTLAREAGLVPPERQRTQAELREAYAGHLLLQDCLVQSGYEVDAPPTIDAFVASGGDWDPYLAIPFSDIFSITPDAPDSAREQYEASLKLREACDPNLGYWVRLARLQGGS